MDNNSRTLTTKLDIKFNQETIDQLTAIAKAASTLTELITAFTAEYDVVQETTKSGR